MNSMNLIQDKFLELGFDSYDEIQADVDARINKFEKNMKIHLPETYKYFLKNYGECNFQQDAVYKPIKSTPFQNKRGFMEIIFFYGCGSKNSIDVLVERYKGRIPNDYIVIAEAPGGNQICMNVAAGTVGYGNIYLWDHENECDGCMDNIYLISESFDKFIDSFMVDETGSTTGAIGSRYDF